MRKILASTHKELLILLRDIPGLLLLFLMPVFLIIIVTIAQQKALDSTQSLSIDVLFLNNDNEELGEIIETGLTETGFFNLIKEKDNQKIDLKSLKKYVSAGDYQIGIVIPEGASKIACKKAAAIVDSIHSDSLFNLDEFNKIQNNTKVLMYFDPAASKSYQSSLTSALNMLIQAAEFNILMDNFFKKLPDQIQADIKKPISKELTRQLKIMEIEFNKQLKKKLGTYAPKDINIKIPDDTEEDINKNLNLELNKFNLQWKPKTLIGVKEEIAQNSTSFFKPSNVSQNSVPAFTLFAMFFIVIPLAGSMILEKNEGAYDRLRTLPVSYFTILSGKVVIYTVVCMFQFALMLLIGKFVLPWFDVSAIEIGNQYFTIFIAALASSLAAIGFGLLIGSFSTTIGQAAMFGSIMVVVLGIVGGVFIPVYLLPEKIAFISIISPIRWGIDSFLDIFARGGNLFSIKENVFRLIAFFLAGSFISVMRFIKKN